MWASITALAAAMDVNNISRVSALAGATVVLSDLASPLAGAIARRLASQTGSMIVASAEVREARIALAELERVRLISGQYGQLSFHQLDASTESGAAQLLEEAKSDPLPVDAVIHVAAPNRRDPANSLRPLLPMLQRGCEVLGMQDSGRIVMVLDLTGTSASAYSSGARTRMDLLFETLIRAKAHANYAKSLCVNGVIVQPGKSQADCSFALSTGPGASPGAFRNASADVHSAAAGVVELLASASSCGITGQVFRIGGRPEAPAHSAELASLLEETRRPQ
jgi:NAD(P)-dependent dehydrogenase (short-subunit alcohol dehydrogenase family)